MTAVEWLQDQYDNSPESILIEDDFKQAKEMEKEQIIKANRDGVDMVVHKKVLILGEQYYNETFKSE